MGRGAIGRGAISSVLVVCMGHLRCQLGCMFMGHDNSTSPSTRFPSSRSPLPWLRLQAEEEEGGAAERIATAGQQFAYRYLHATAKAMYVRAAITEYNKLFQVNHWCLWL